MAVPFVKLSPLVRVIKTVNDNLEQQAQAIYHERFETVSPNDLPSDWRIVTLGEVATISNKSFIPLKEPETLLEHYSIPAFAHRRTGNSVGYEPKRDNNTADFLMDFPTSWTCATAGLPCNNDFITFATKPYIRYFLKEL